MKKSSFLRKKLRSLENHVAALPPPYRDEGDGTPALSHFVGFRLSDCVGPSGVLQLLQQVEHLTQARASRLHTWSALGYSGAGRP